MGRLIAVGDIHGELKMLEQLIMKLQPQDDDTLVFLGDYIDRGPDSRGVLDLLIDGEYMWEGRVTYLMGNHEHMACVAGAELQIEQNGSLLDGEWGQLWLYNGGDKMVAQYRGDEEVDALGAHMLWMMNRPVVARVNHAGRTFIFAHAGLDPDKSVQSQLDKPHKEQSDEELAQMLWRRLPFLDQNFKPSWGDDVTVVCGHSPRHRPYVTPNLVNLDGGACFQGYGKLRAGVWSETGELEIIEVAREEVYGDSERQSRPQRV